MINSYNLPLYKVADTPFHSYSPTVEDGPKWKLAFRYPVSQFFSDFYEIL